MVGQLVTVKTFLHKKNCKNYGLANDFAKVCRKTKLQMRPKPRVNNVDDTFPEAATFGTSTTAEEQVNQIEIKLQRHSIDDANYDSDYDEFDDNSVTLNSDSDNIREVKPAYKPSYRKY